MPRKIALAYSGGLDTSAIVPWLKEHFPGSQVVCVVGDVGQGADELTGVEQKAKNSGAAECHVVNLQREFCEDYLFPMLLSGAVYEGRYLLGTSIARPILAKAQVDVALKTGCDAVAHGCTGKGNDQVRFESTYAALAPQLEVIAPWRLPNWELKSREALLAYLKSKNVPTTASATKLYSRDRNLWHISHEGGELEDPWNAPPEDVWMLTRSVAEAPNEPQDVSLTFERGRPRTLNDEKLAPETLIAKLNELAGRHGVGRVDIVENRRVGMKSRGCYETPGGTVLMEALRGLEELVHDRDTLQWRQEVAHRFTYLIYDGAWFTPMKEAIVAAVEKLAEPLTGEVVVRLHKGRATTIKRRSPNSLYTESIATFGETKAELYSHADATGFIKLLALPMKIRALKRSGNLK
ncbi:MAG TPA: argininosuccinate synthase [Phycisphaerales bacterium]|nr:argininosuccinate synthase [Phycisphaerales bacterium]